MKNPEEEMQLHIRPRPTETVTLEIPKDALESIEKVAARRDMSRQALLKLYIGQGLRQDLTKVFADRLMEKTAQMLSRHIESEEEFSAIIREIQHEATTYSGLRVYAPFDIEEPDCAIKPSLTVGLLTRRTQLQTAIKCLSKAARFFH